MRFFSLTPATPTIQYSTGLLMLVLFCSGCNNQADSFATQTCSEAEKAVAQAQKEFEQVEDKLANYSQAEIETVNTSIVQKLQESQEYAFQICEQGG